MTFHLTEDQATIQQLARDFAQSELAPIAAQIDQEERIPKEIIEKMAEIGFTALNVPEAYGGPELDTMCKVLVVSELAKQCASTAEVISVHTLVNDIFLKHGTEAARALVYEAACAADSGEPLSKLAAMCKYYASENAVWVTNKALQIHGGYGYMRDYPIERMYRDARIVPIYEGTSEIQKVVIARELLK